MVILITGASHTGKTLLAQRLLEAFGYPYLSVDHLKMGLIRSGNTALTPYDDEALTAYLWPIVREIVKTAVENRQNLIVEGCYIPCDWRRDFDGAYLSAIRWVCLAMTEAYVDAHFEEIKAYGSVIEKRLTDPDFTADLLKEENRAFIDGCREAGEEVSLIDGDYESAIAALPVWRLSGNERRGEARSPGGVRRMKRAELTVYEPEIKDLWFRRDLLSDGETMSYNRAWGGTVPFPEERWGDWYDRWVAHPEGKRYYRYVRDERGAFVGEIAYHFDGETGCCMANVIIHARYRGRGYGGRALELLCERAKEDGVSLLYDDIAIDNPAVGMFLARGFTEERRTAEKIILVKRL